MKLSGLKYLTISLLLTSSLFVEGAEKHDNLKLWYTSPAKTFQERLPLGNGRLGIMPDGGIQSERIVLNDITMWSGSDKEDPSNPEASKYLPQIRELLLQGKNLEAQNLMYEHFVPLGTGSNYGNGKDASYGCFQMLGNLDIEYFFKNHTGEIANVSDYERGLSLQKAVAYTSFKLDNKKFTREYFVSRSHDLIVIKLTSSEKKNISFKLRLQRPERVSFRNERNKMIMEGNLNSGIKGVKGIGYQTKVEAKLEGGTVLTTDSMMEVKDANTVYIFVSSATSFRNNDYKTQVDKLLQEAEATSYDKLKIAHQKAHALLFNRAVLNLRSETPDLPTDQRILSFQKKDDPSLAALYFSYGRYLLISSTRPGLLPPNLQGLWADSVQTPWNGDYHLNINVQMNHWPVEPSNLSELNSPLIEFTKGLVKSGERTAKVFYNAKGWVAHVIANPWGYTAPGEHPSWGATNTGGAWLCAHLWEHYLYSGDKEYLKDIYPVLKGASEFFLSTMIKEPKHGWLVTAPTSSPENAFYVDESKDPISVCLGPTMDNQLVKELYSNVIQAAEILNIDNDYCIKLKEAYQQLPPHQISKGGYLMEWLEDYKETDIHHRHISHLYGLYPGNQITLTKTPELAEACKATLNRRGDEGTGWSRAWKINFWARLGDGNRAYKLFKSLLNPTFNLSKTEYNGGGTYPNLFCAHPPFQIDGNFGGTSGIAEMLLQSHDGFIEFLPACPDNWSEGSYKGFKSRGGAAVDIEWDNSLIRKARITASFANTFKVKVPRSSVVQVKTTKGKVNYSNREFIELNLKKGEKAELAFKYQ